MHTGTLLLSEHYLPVSLVALLISVEPLIDMGRTALNVNGSMTAGAITSQIMGQTDKALLDAWPRQEPVVAPLL